MKMVLKIFLGFCLSIQLIGTADAQTVEYIHTDALGTPIAVTDAGGNVIERSEYAPYGELLNRPTQDGPGFTGHVQDASTGLTYMQQRYYDPALGIFYSRDPVTALSDPVRQFNPYRYANSNPYKFTDPDGRSVTCDETRCIGMSHSLGEAIIDTIHVQAVYFSRLMQHAAGNVQRSDSSEAQDQAEPGTAESDEGCIYCVDGANTESGKDYVGSADDLGRRAATAKDGRDRGGAEKVDRYKKGDRADRQNKEQKAMNERGGKENLDNKRNEVAPDKWKDRDIPPPNRQG